MCQHLLLPTPQCPIIDELTQEPIPKERLVTFREGGTNYCFDVRSLARMYMSTDKFENPFTRQRLASDVQKRIEDHIRETMLKFEIEPNNINARTINFTLSPFEDLGTLFFASLRESGILPDDILKYILQYRSNNEFRSIYQNQDLTISLENVPFEKNLTGTITLRLTDPAHILASYAKDRDKDYIYGFLPQKYWPRGYHEPQAAQAAQARPMSPIRALPRPTEAEILIGNVLDRQGIRDITVRQVRDALRELGIPTTVR